MARTTRAKGSKTTAAIAIVCALSLIDELAETHPEIAAELKEARGWTLQASEDWKLKLGAPEPRGEGDPWHLLHGHLVLAAKEMPPSSLIEEAQRAAEHAQRRLRTVPDGGPVRALHAPQAVPADSTAREEQASTSDYEAFVARKLTRVPPTGIAGFDGASLNPSLFDHQRALVTWALKRGRSAIFADTGLGKTAMQLEWSRHVSAYTSGRVLILAPLSVAAQTVDEGARLGLDVTLVREAEDVRDGVNIINYDRLHKIDPSVFSAVVLDESSIIKHHDAKTLQTLLEAFASTPFKLCATATPAPNDFVELGTHAEFLGICTREEMLAEYFTHDGGETQKWRLKGHAQAEFWKWVATWGALVRKPSDLGFDDSAYALPPLTVQEHVAASSWDAARESGILFPMPAKTLSERRSARRGSIGDRVRMCVELVNASDEPWVVWCELNDESDALTAAIRDAVEVRGSMTADEKERALEDFAKRGRRVLVSKPSICGFGLNWQHCCNIAFVGVTDSWESYYQAIRRCWRFGQKREVRVHVFASELEGNVVANLKRKDEAALRMAEQLSAWTRDAVSAEVRGSIRVTNSYAPSKALIVPSWLREVA
jgi:superfamily II DNA or RNA helicase